MSGADYSWEGIRCAPCGHRRPCPSEGVRATRNADDADQARGGKAGSEQAPGFPPRHPRSVDFDHRAGSVAIVLLPLALLVVLAALLLPVLVFALLLALEARRLPLALLVVLAVLALPLALVVIVVIVIVLLLTLTFLRLPLLVVVIVVLALLPLLGVGLLALVVVLVLLLLALVVLVPALHHLALGGEGGYERPRLVADLALVPRLPALLFLLPPDDSAPGELGLHRLDHRLRQLDLPLVVLVFALLALALVVIVTLGALLRLGLLPLPLVVVLVLALLALLRVGLLPLVVLLVGRLLLLVVGARLRPGAGPRGRGRPLGQRQSPRRRCRSGP